MLAFLNDDRLCVRLSLSAGIEPGMQVVAAGGELNLIGALREEMDGEASISLDISRAAPIDETTLLRITDGMHRDEPGHGFS